MITMGMVTEKFKGMGEIVHGTEDSLRAWEWAVMQGCPGVHTSRVYGYDMLRREKLMHTIVSLFPFLHLFHM